MPVTATTPAKPGESVATLERGLAVVRALAAAPATRMRRSDLARATGLARATVDRVARTLTHLGYLRAEEHDAVLTPLLMELGNAYLAADPLADAADVPARSLADELDESVSVCVPDGDGARFVIQCPRRRAMAVTFHVGDLLPAERCAPGALFAADWDEDTWRHWRERVAPAPPSAPAGDARGDSSGAAGRQGPGSDAAAVPDLAARTERAERSGSAVDDQLVEPGLVAVAVPVRGDDGRVRCAVSVVSHTSRHTADSLADLALPRLRACADTVAEALAEHVPAEPPSPSGRADALRTAKEELGADFLQSLARGLEVLTCLRVTGGRTLTEVAQATGLARATARRSLSALTQLGYVTTVDDRRFTLLPRVLELGYAPLSRLTFERIATPHLADLVRRVHDSASVSVLDGDDIRYVARVATTRVMGVDLGVGTRLPAHPTSMGRVLLAGRPPEELAARLTRAVPERLTEHTRTSPEELAAVVDEARRSGYALVDQELEEGLCSIAVPVRDRDGRVVAAVNVAAHAAQRGSDSLREEVLPELREAARRIEADLAAASERNPGALPS
ncbi:IclR family transcriptional regulator C-terminal domain-containing protein [Nocardiopsis sp. NPDC049922]|uniref:IclR family transcriptional regulator domain-containing protein n=1 Tax=Nocardiopsis sp. NPDC049922 TaxID=3155157 RepID=UPI003408085F